MPTTTGRAAVRNGPNRWRTALIGATTMSGPPALGVPPSAPPPNCQSSRSRRPIVDTSGLTRSKGRVSQAGKTSTFPDPPPGVKAPRSWANCSADVPVGVITRTGRRDPRRTRPARTKAWAWVATARVALDAPTTRVMAGSLRSRAGSERRLTRSGYRGPVGARARSRTGGRRLVGYPGPSAALTRFIAAAGPSVMMASTASAAVSMAASRTARSAVPGRLST